MILLDTDTYTLHLNRPEEVLERCRTASEVPAITIITEIEVLRGRHHALFTAEDGSRLLRHSSSCTTLHHMMQFQVVPFDAAAVAEFDRRASTKDEEDRAGRSAHRQHRPGQRATLVTRNSQDQVPGLRIENWAD
ncbi:MAG: type II toxin-antitoxin system VapC family toxin [Gemmataceae bacterium]